MELSTQPIWFIRWAFHGSDGTDLTDPCNITESMNCFRLKVEAVPEKSVKSNCLSYA